MVSAVFPGVDMLAVDVSAVVPAMEVVVMPGLVVPPGFAVDVQAPPGFAVDVQAPPGSRRYVELQTFSNSI